MSLMNRLPCTRLSGVTYITVRGEAGGEPHGQCARTLSNTELFTRTTLRIEGKKKVLWRTTAEDLVSFLQSLHADDLTSFEFYILNEGYKLVMIPLEELVSLKYGGSPAK